ncbi:MAG: UbiX family flavin prenyltransferase, partial [Abditibacteriales bacterium]|nr:UbiX family flavin prenyltransferase [Abditibacteriales bacterium]MDW8368215.1 flavin prenyltransferase UbiX [Abditibacteriales bacterium]
ITGASGVIYGLRLLQRLGEERVPMALTLSEPACRVMAEELDLRVSVDRPDLPKLVGRADAEVRYYHPKDVGAAIASGSFRHRGMVIVPCSMGTLGRIAHGTSDDLITRAADVCLKERRPLILVPRETPLSLVHINNMKAVTEAGAIVLPAAPPFYHKPQTVMDMVDAIIGRILDHLGIDSTQTPRWKAEEE